MPIFASTHKFSHCLDPSLLSFEYAKGGMNIYILKNLLISVWHQCLKNTN